MWAEDRGMTDEELAKHYSSQPDLDLDDAELCQGKIPGSQIPNWEALEQESSNEQTSIVTDDCVEDQKQAALPPQKQQSSSHGPSKSDSVTQTNHKTSFDDDDDSFPDNIDWDLAMKEIEPKIEAYHKASPVTKRQVSQEQEPARSRKKQKRNRDSEERKTVQRKISDLFVPKQNLASDSPVRQIQDTDDTWHLGKDRLFKKHESFTCEQDDALKHVIYTIDTVKSVKNKKCAVCHNGAHMYLRGTFIGEEHANRLCQDQRWRAHFKDGQGKITKDYDKVKCLQRHMFERGNTIPLAQLTKRIPFSHPPASFLVYDAPPHHKTARSDGFECTYMTLKMLQKDKYWAELVDLKLSPKVLELFAGCGGMHQGFKEAGFHPESFLVERDPCAAGTLKTNFPQAHVFVECVRIFLKCCKNGHPGYPKRGDVGHIQASPPCQGQSQANRNIERSASDITNNELSYTFLEAVAFFLPKTATFENVTGMLSNKNIGYVKKIMADLLLLGYQCRLIVLNASDYGDPQNRKRVIIFAARFGCYLPDVPVPQKKITVRQALQHLKAIRPTPGSGRVKRKDGKIILHHGIEDGLGVKDGNDNFHLSQCPDGLAPCLRRQNDMKHPDLPRQITIRERACLQSFPDDFNFVGGITSQRDQIGNAVPIKLATCIARQVLLAHKKVLRRKKE